MAIVIVAAICLPIIFFWQNLRRTKQLEVQATLTATDYVAASATYADADPGMLFFISKPVMVIIGK